MPLSMSRRGVLTALAASGTAAVLARPLPASAAASPAQHAEVEAGHASPELVAAVTSALRDKNTHDVGRTMEHFSRRQLTYTDGTLGLNFPDWDSLRALFATYMPQWPASARSYPTRIIGEANSGVVLMTDTPEMFGGEIRAISTVDLSAGRIVRQVDYWDSRHFGVATAAGLRVPDGQYPAEFGERQTGERAHPTIRRVATALAKALSAGDARAATALFTPDAVFEDLALHAQFIGSKAINGFLGRALPLLPYGSGTVVRHVVGGVLGGGYEWRSVTHRTRVGVIALELSRQALITRLTTTWDAGALNDAAMTALLTKTLES